MAAPYRWTREFVKAGWLRVGALSPAGLRFLFAAGHFFDKRDESALTDRQTLQKLTGLKDATFYAVRNELCAKGLIQTQDGKRRGKYREYDCTDYHLVLPVPPVPAEYLSTSVDRSSPGSWRERSRRTEKKVQKRRELLSPRARSHAASDASQTVVRSSERAVAVLEEPSAVKNVIARVVEERLPGSSPSLVGLVESWARVVQRSPDSREQKLRDAAAAIAKKHGVSPADARETVEDAVACLHPLVQAAVRIFDTQVERVTRLGAAQAAWGGASDG